ncbi:MAG TPA: helicase [Hyphomonas sp.]|jgi:ATP-dependent RNA helicase SUPV3L1/SUV3|uniref:helicase-related protein n=3 Tax=Hyphomonas TaxID=85 RepID=UPI000C3F8A71|nr:MULTISPECIES: helicase-related protein [unclassified Hyphomonas]MAL44746.1 helicase [Hyphomonas sp.]MAX84034.1 helicase [Hyphomonas sp.]HBN93600.1 helicase [Hyphomonas sp.]HBU35257.1 helicase [Hyphomonas sp.]|tara:strand:- start:1098 stop:3824 length:2727 start_codon:yes stop_codon:yes gene_type:complete
MSSTLKAILGPTNTGKTHYAIERMTGFGTGMIGLPLRLLAREVYDRVVERKGAAHVALITGEERIVPRTARYWVCTVESMPVDLKVDFVAIDEIQLAEDQDRGHVFTDRILNLRGNHETLLLGSDTMRSVLRKLDLGAETEPRERFSELRYTGHCKITKLPKRTAIVAFSADEVYAIGELLRRQKGGAAIVMGALSPRTRNSQVELYQSGEVDYIVATDAIGMGLNLDVDRVVFASRSKFDGRRHRLLTPAECAQIAGRAGRFRTDGEFGETATCPPFDEATWQAIEAHRFDPVDHLQWRNSALDFSSLRRLILSLETPSGHPSLIHNPHALDEWVLRRMAEDAAIGPNVAGAREVRRLWDLARLPDFRKAGPEGHARLVLGLAETLANPDARLADKGLERRLDDLSSTQGDIAKLQQRLANIRTWTYAAHRPDWLENPEKWQDRTREIEDSLSDALHEALTARFVDRRTTALLASLKKEDALVTELTPEGDVRVEGHVVGRLKGLTFEPVLDARTLEGKAVRSAAQAAVRPLILERLSLIVAAPDDAFKLNDEGQIEHINSPVAHLAKGSSWMAPRVEIVGASEVDPAEREAARQRLEQWAAAETAKILPTHTKLAVEKAGDALEGLARGIAFRLLETGAAVDLRQDDPSLRLTGDQREALKGIGVRAGRVAAHVPDAQKPAGQRMIAILRAVFEGQPFPLAPEGAGSFALDGTWPEEALAANGYLRFGRRAVRADLAERLGWEIAKRRKEASKNAFPIEIDLASVVSCPADDWPAVLKGFGLAPAEKDKETDAVTLWRYASRARPEGRSEGGRPPQRGRDQNAGGKGPKGPRGPKQQGGGGRSNSRSASQSRQPDPDSPFAALAALLPEPKQAANKPKKKKRKPKPKPEAAAESAADTSFEYKPFQ